MELQQADIIHVGEIPRGADGMRGSRSSTSAEVGALVDEVRGGDSSTPTPTPTRQS